jgi:hypothetical protein
MNGFVQEQGQMELMIRRPTKGLLSLSQDATVASVRIEGGGTRQFVVGLSINFIRSTSDISYEIDRSIRFLPAFDCADSTRSPP